MDGNNSNAVKPFYLQLMTAEIMAQYFHVQDRPHSSHAVWSFYDRYKSAPGLTGFCILQSSPPLSTYSSLSTVLSPEFTPSVMLNFVGCPNPSSTQIR